MGTYNAEAKITLHFRKAILQSEDDKTVKTAIPTVDEINARLSQPIKDPLIGTKIAGGRYEILDVLGEGGMSIVYKAKQELVDRIVAIKTLRMSLSADPNLIKRFDREIKTLSRLNHPNIVTVFDCVLGDNGQPYFIMDFLQGYSLQDLLNEDQREYHRLSAGRAKNIFLQVCNAVDHAHRSGIVHRDLKPANIMLMDLSGQEFVKVVDFGLAKIGEEAQRITQTGEIWGSPLYMSPEQCNGVEMDARSDIYSLGAVMYECLTGSVPISGKTFLETIQKVVGAAVPPFAQVAPDLKLSPGIEQIVMRCLQKNPDDRFQTMMELKDAIERNFPADDEALMRTLPPGKMEVDRAAAMATKELKRDAQSLIPTQRLRRDATMTESATASKAAQAKSGGPRSNPARSSFSIPQKGSAPGAKSKTEATVNPLVASVVGGLIVALAFIIVFLVVQSINQQQSASKNAAVPVAPLAAPTASVAPTPSAAVTPASATKATATASANSSPVATTKPTLNPKPVSAPDTVRTRNPALKSEQPKPAVKPVFTPNKTAIGLQHKTAPTNQLSGNALAVQAHPQRTLRTDKEVWEEIEK